MASLTGYFTIILNKTNLVSYEPNAALKPPMIQQRHQKLQWDNIRVNYGNTSSNVLNPDHRFSKLHLFGTLILRSIFFFWFYGTGFLCEVKFIRIKNTYIKFIAKNMRFEHKFNKNFLLMEFIVPMNLNTRIDYLP